MAETISPRPDWKPLAGLLCLALAARCAVIWLRADQLTIDRDAYLGIAENIVRGNGFCTPGTATPTAFRPPLYPLLLAAMMTILPTALAVAAINLVAGVWTVWLVDRMGVALGLGGWRHLAALFVAVDPLLLNATPQPMTEVLFTALTTAWLWTVIGSPSDGHRVSRAFLIGVLFGLAALCRPTIWPLAGLIGVVWLLRVVRLASFVPSPPPRGRGAGERGGAVPRLEPGEKSSAGLLVEAEASGSARPLSLTLSPEAGARGLEVDRFRLGWCVAAGTLIVVGTWVARNQVVLGHSVWTTTHGGYTLLLANNPTFDADVVRQPWGTTWSGESLNRWQTEVDAEAEAALGARARDELVKDRWLSQQAKDYIHEHPNRFLAAMGYRVRKLWSVAPHGEGRSLPEFVRLAVAAFYLLEYALAGWGFWRIIRGNEWRAWLPALLLIATIQGVHLCYWTDARMRTPLVPVLALLAARAFAKDAQG